MSVRWVLMSSSVRFVSVVTEIKLFYRYYTVLLYEPNYIVKL